MNSLITKAKLFFSSYKWLLFPLVPIIIFTFIILYFFSAQKNLPTQNTKQQNTTEISQSSEPSSQTEVSVSPAEQTESSPDQILRTSIYTETNDIAAGKLKFEDESDGNKQNTYPDDDEVDEGSINTRTLPDGSTEYEYPSDDPNRQHMQIIKDDVVIFRRNIMSNNDMTLTDYSDFLSNPEYTSQGSSYYGANAMIYASPTKGIAVVANPQTRQVYEQYLFQAMSVNDYLQKYGSDISAYSP